MAMTFYEFKNYFAEHLKEFLPEEHQDVSIRLTEVTKNNDQRLSGLAVEKPGLLAAPTLYLNKPYEDYAVHGVPVQDIISAMADSYAKVLDQNLEKPVLASTNDITDWNKVKDKVTIKLLSAEKNTAYLADKPYTEMMDMAISYKIELGQAGNDIASIPITESIMKQYGVSKEELHKTAMENFSKKDYEFTNMGSMLAQMAGDKSLGDAAYPMYVLTTTDHLNGASLIASNEIMEQISEELGENFVVLPSSVHEVIILPESVVVERPDSFEGLKYMVMDVNANVLPPIEFLSNNVFVYDTKEHELMISDDYVREDKGIEME